MLIGGVVKNSFVDYPGVLACSVFTAGCNMRCWYCHNKHLLDKNLYEKNLIKKQDLLEFLKSRIGFLEGVVVSGGEPTCQKDLPEFLREIKQLDFLVKLDTNGTNFDMLKYVVENKLVDYVAMDIKAPFEKYKAISAITNETIEIEKSAQFLMKNGVKYEFRTTVCKGLGLQDLEQIAKNIAGAENLFLQKCNTNFDGKENKNPDKNMLLEAKQICEKYVKNVYVRGID